MLYETRERLGVRKLAAAFTRRKKGGSKLPHSKAARLKSLCDNCDCDGGVLTAALYFSIVLAMGTWPLQRESGLFTQTLKPCPDTKTVPK